MKADPALGGLRPIDTHLPGMMIILSVLTCAFSLLPTVLVTYRERGILRRMSTTPVSPVTVLGVQLVLNVATTLVTTLLMLVIGNLVYDVPFPRAPLAFTAGAAAGHGVRRSPSGCCWPRSAVTPGSPRASAWRCSSPTCFFAGMWVPRSLMPDAVRVVADFTPSGAFGAAIVEVLTDRHRPVAAHRRDGRVGRGRRGRGRAVLPVVVITWRVIARVTHRCLGSEV